MSDKFKSIDEHNFSSIIGYNEKTKKNLYEELNIEPERNNTKPSKLELALKEASKYNLSDVFYIDERKEKYPWQDNVIIDPDLDNTVHPLKGLHYDPVKSTYVKDENSEKKFTFDEDKYVSELLEYIKSTYTQHYAQGKYQATEVIFDKGHGLGFCWGSSQKYLARYGKKEGYNRKDLLKALHYIIMLLYIHDTEHLGE